MAEQSVDKIPIFGAKTMSCSGTINRRGFDAELTKDNTAPMRRVCWTLPLLLVAACSDVGSATIDAHGHLTAHNDKPFPVLSAGKIIPAAMALERQNPPMGLIERSVVDSDNAASDELVASLGGAAAVRRWLTSKHLPAKFALEREMVANPRVMELRPSELALVLYRIKSPKLVALMARTKTGNDRIRAAFPGAPHKSGTLGSNLTDVGIVGERVVAVMGQGTATDLATSVSRLQLAE